MPSETKSVRERIEEALREIGVLLLAFAPLDAVVTPFEGAARRVLLLFIVLGLLLFLAALVLERERR